MSVHVSSWVWKHSKASNTTDLLVLLALADQAHDNGSCWPGVKNIAERCRCSTRTVNRSLHNLVEIGELKVLHRYAQNGDQTSNYYQINCGIYGATVSSTPLTDCQYPPDTDVTTPLTPVAPKPLSEPPSSRKKKDIPGSEQEVIAYCLSLGLTANDGSAIFNSWQANGFRTKSGPIKDWKASVRTWNCNNWFPSQQKPRFSKPMLADGESVDAQGFICDATCLGGPPRRRRDAQGNYVRAGGQG